MPETMVIISDSIIMQEFRSEIDRFKRGSFQNVEEKTKDFLFLQPRLAFLKAPAIPHVVSKSIIQLANKVHSESS